MSGIGTICALVLECSDPPRLARFWSDVLGVRVSECDGAWASLDQSPCGRMSFQAVKDYQPPAWPGDHGGQQMHLDVLVDDLPVATRQVIGWGAIVLTEVLDPGPKEWRVFADPAGHPFCLVTVAE